MTWFHLQRSCGCVKDGRDGTFLRYCRKHEPEAQPIYIILLALVIIFAFGGLFVA